MKITTDLVHNWSLYIDKVHDGAPELIDVNFRSLSGDVSFVERVTREELNMLVWIQENKHLFRYLSDLKEFIDTVSAYGDDRENFGFKSGKSIKS
jgi:hypothetical protein